MNISQPKVRLPNFDLNNFEKEWMLSSPLLTHLFNALSIMVTELERNVIRSSKINITKINNSGLKELIDIYIKQEAVHSKLHHTYNERLKELGYHLDHLEAFVKKTVNILERFPRLMTAFVASNEHLTSFLGEYVFSVRESEIPKGNVFYFFKWHGAEEIEHSHICFDICKELGITYLLRITTFIISLFMLTLFFLYLTFDLLLQDKKLISVQNFKELYCFLFTRKFTKNIFLIELLLKSIDYFKFDFYPLNYKKSIYMAENFLNNLS